MMCFVKYCIQYKMYTAYEIGGGEGVREKDAMSRVCVCVPHSGCLLNFGGKNREHGPERLGVRQTECLCEREREREREGERD